MGKNRRESNKKSEIWEKMGNQVPFERAMGPNRHSMENYWDLQPITRSMKPTFWVPSENLSFGLLPKQIAFDQRDSKSGSNFKRAMDRGCQALVSCFLLVCKLQTLDTVSFN